MLEELPCRGRPRKYLGPRPRRRDFQRGEAGAREIVDPQTKELHENSEESDAHLLVACVAARL
jgi:hypothetical protein